MLAGDGGVTLQELVRVFDKLIEGGVDERRHPDAAAHRSGTKAVSEAVDDVIALRAQDPDGTAPDDHVVVRRPRRRRSCSSSSCPRLGCSSRSRRRRSMTISLGGTPGPRSTGMTPIGARPVEEVAPEPKRPDARARRRAEARRDDRADEAAGQAAQARHEAGDHSPASPPVDRATDDRPPGRRRARPRSRRARRGEGAGLTVGGGGGGAQLEVDSDFCCPAYLQDVRDAHQRPCGATCSRSTARRSWCSRSSATARSRTSCAETSSGSIAARSALARDADRSGAEAAAAAGGVHPTIT